MSAGPLSITALLGPDNQADQLRELLHDVIDPELGIDVVSLGLIYRIELTGRTARVVATTTTPACPLGDYISDEIHRVLLASGAVDTATVEITHEPPWTPQMMAESAKRAFGW